MFTTQDSNPNQFENLSSYSSEKEYKKRKKNRRNKTALKTIIGIFCALLIFCGCGMIYLSTDLFSDLSTVSITKDNKELGIRPDASNDTSITNIAFFGLDTRDGSFQGLSDAIMVVTVDNKHGKIKMTSILRDTRIPEIEGVGTAKINEAYYYGGAELAIKTLNQNFGLNITDFITVNFNQTAEVVNAFGGTELELTSEEVYYTNKNLEALMYEQIHDGHERTIWERDYLPVDAQGNGVAGKYVLTGNQAVAYARNRSDSDLERANRQKKVLMGLFKKLETMPGTKYYSLAQQIFPKCQTSLDFSDIWNLAPLMSSGFTMETLNIPGPNEYAQEGDQGDGLGWVWDYDLELAAQNIDRFIYEDASQFKEKSDKAQDTKAQDKLSM